jgi:hypothetical protein
MACPSEGIPIVAVKAVRKSCSIGMIVPHFFRIQHHPRNPAHTPITSQAPDDYTNSQRRRTPFRARWRGSLNSPGSAPLRPYSFLIECTSSEGLIPAALMARLLLMPACCPKSNVAPPLRAARVRLKPSATPETSLSLPHWRVALQFRNPKPQPRVPALATPEIGLSFLSLVTVKNREPRHCDSMSKKARSSGRRGRVLAAIKPEIPGAISGSYHSPLFGTCVISERPASHAVENVCN